MKYIPFDIETRKTANADRMIPEFKAPRINKDGSKHASDKSIEEQKEAWVSDCALSPLTGEVCMITMFTQNNVLLTLHLSPFKYDTANCWYHRSEKLLLEDFWSNFRTITDSGSYIVSFGRFDINFIITRSRILGIELPIVINPLERYIPMYIDLAEVLRLYDNSQDKRYISLENYALAFGLEKPKYKEYEGKDVGANFGWFLDNQPEIALAHNKEDVEILNELIKRTLTK